MELYLMHHGQALAAEENPERPLSREGVEQIGSSAAAIRRMKISPEIIVASPKKRSRQSAALVAEAVNYPYSDIVVTDLAGGLVPPEESLAFLERFAGRKVLIAGHLPSLAGIASTLLTGGADLRLRFANGALCRIDAPSPGSGKAELGFFLSPEQMRLIAAPP